MKFGEFVGTKTNVNEGMGNTLNLSKLKDSDAEKLLLGIEKEGKEGTDYEFAKGVLKYSDKMKSFIKKYVKENASRYQTIVSEEEKEKKKKVDIGNIIKALIDTSWSGDNEAQMKAVQLLKGVALSDDPRSNKFMKGLDTYTSGLKAEDFK